jgi:hypothetical protein
MGEPGAKKEMSYATFREQLLGEDLSQATGEKETTKPPAMLTGVQLVIIDSLVDFMLSASEYTVQERGMRVRASSPTFAGGLQPCHILLLKHIDRRFQQFNIALVGVLNTVLFPIAGRMGGAIAGTAVPDLPNRRVMIQDRGAGRTGRAIVIPDSAWASALAYLKYDASEVVEGSLATGTPLKEVPSFRRE